MRKRILRVLLLLVCAADAAFGCEALPLKLRKVSPNLTIVVTHRDKPRSGIRVQVVPAKSPEAVFTGVTDEHGTVLIRGLAPRQYYVTVSHDDFAAQTEWIKVVGTPDIKAAKRLDFQWADWSSETSRVAGTLTGLIPGSTGNKLMDIVHPVKTSYPGVEMTLKETFSGNEFHTISDSSGGFIFSDVPDGVYVLTIAGGMKSVTGMVGITRQVIDVARGSKRDFLPMQIKESGCGGAEFALSEE